MDVVFQSHPLRGFFQRQHLVYDKRDDGVADAGCEASRRQRQMIHRQGKMLTAHTAIVLGVSDFEDGGTGYPDFAERALSGGMPP